LSTARSGKSYHRYFNRTYDVAVPTVCQPLAAGVESNHTAKNDDVGNVSNASSGNSGGHYINQSRNKYLDRKQREQRMRDNDTVVSRRR